MTTYASQHRRVKRQRGVARQHPCADECGRRADQWAHVHDTDPEDTQNYRPLCYSCHQKYDGNRGVALRYGGTTCTNGHEYTPENTVARPDGGRLCKACRRDIQKRHYRKINNPTKEES